MNSDSSLPRPLRLSIARAAAAFGLCAALLATAATSHAISPPESGAEQARVLSGTGGIAQGVARVRARLVFEHEHATPGTTLAAGVVIETDPGWHVYWRNPGEIGLPTQLSWQLLPAGVGQVGEALWPSPRVFYDADLEMTSYGYEGRVLLEAPIEISPAASARAALEVALDLEFVVCEYECVPGSIALGTQLPVASSLADTSQDAALFEDARAQHPRTPASLDLDVEIVRPAGDTSLAAVVLEPCASGSPGCSIFELPKAVDALSALFLPVASSDESGFEVSVLSSLPHPTASHGFMLELQLEPARAGDEAPRRDAIAGLIPLARGNGEIAYVEVAIPDPRSSASSTRAPIAPGPEADSGSAAGLAALARMLLFALAGGLILNLMPCVLPVLAIKVVALAEIARASRRQAFAHGAAYTGGVVGSLLLLGIAVVVLQRAGVSVGWGFQFQDPTFLAVLAVVLVAFALNLFGVYEITYQGGRLAGIGNEASGWRRSLFEGLLAVLLATPCSAPFLGTAVGFAFAASPGEALAVFTMIGVGLALPFALISLMPSMARLLPKPGRWMLHLRAGLGFAVLASAVWILHIASALVSSATLVMLVAILVGVGFIAWLLGTVQRSGRPRLALNAGMALATLCMIALVSVPLEQRAEQANPRPSDPDGIATFSRQSLDASLSGGHPTFVYFTAEWCLTCKVNEEMVLDDERVRGRLDALGFRVLRADWTQRDEGIRSELARFGKAGVPLYLVYSPADPQSPQILPELLRIDATIAALERAAN